MCTGITETAQVKGSGKGPDGWFKLEEVNVSYDHPTDASLERALNIDFVNPKIGLSARVAVELSPESAKKLAVELSPESAKKLAETILTTLARGEDHMKNSEASSELG